VVDKLGTALRGGKKTSDDMDSKKLLKKSFLEKGKAFSLEGLGIITQFPGCDAVNLGLLLGALETIAKVGAVDVAALDPLILHNFRAKGDMSSATKIADEIYDSTMDLYEKLMGSITRMIASTYVV
jgi:hypothetical protein